MSSNNLNEYGCINLVGAVLNQAIEDAVPHQLSKNKHLNKYNKSMNDDAKEFILSKRRVRKFLDRFGLSNMNANYIVERAKLVIKDGGTRRKGHIGRKDIDVPWSMQQSPIEY